MGAVKLGDPLVEDALQLLPDLHGAFGGFAVVVQMAHRFADGGPRQHLFGLLRHIAVIRWYSDQPHI